MPASKMWPLLGEPVDDCSAEVRDRRAARPILRVVRWWPLIFLQLPGLLWLGDHATASIGPWRHW